MKREREKKGWDKYLVLKYANYALTEKRNYFNNKKTFSGLNIWTALRIRKCTKKLTDTPIHTVQQTDKQSCTHKALLADEKIMHTLTKYISDIYVTNLKFEHHSEKKKKSLIEIRATVIALKY